MKSIIILALIFVTPYALKAQWIVGSSDTGGVGNYGTIVKVPYGYDTVQYTYSMLGGLNGYKPRSLTRACDGTIYGIADGGIGNHGIIFSFNPTTNVYTKKIDLHASGCWYPYGISYASNGKIYGSTGAPIDTAKSYFFEYNPTTNVIIKRDSTTNYFSSSNYNDFISVFFTRPCIGKGNFIYYATPSANVYDQNFDFLGGGAKLIKYNMTNNVRSIIDSTWADEFVTSITQNSDSGLYIQEYIITLTGNTSEVRQYKNGWQPTIYSESVPWTTNHNIYSPFIQHQDGKMYRGTRTGFQCYANIFIFKYNLNGTSAVAQTIVLPSYSTSDLDAYIQVYKMPDAKIYYASNEGSSICGNNVSRIGHFNITTNQFTQVVSTNLLNSMIYSGKDFLGKDVTKFILPNQKYNLTKANQSPEFTLSYRKSNWSIMSTPTQAIVGTYYIIGTSNAGCIDTQKVTVKTGAAPSPYLAQFTEEENAVSVDPIIYPNPVSNSLNIDFVFNEKAYVRVELYDLLGRRVLQKEQECQNGVQSMTIDTRLLHSGVYIVKVLQNGEVTATQKLIKE